MANPFLNLAKRALQGAAKRVAGRTAVGRAFKAAAAELAPIVEPAVKVKNTVDKVTSTANKVTHTVEHGADIALKPIDIVPKELKPSDVIKPVKELKKLPTKLGDASSKYKSADAYEQEAKAIAYSGVFENSTMTRAGAKERAKTFIDNIISDVKDDITASDDENERRKLVKLLDDLEGVYATIDHIDIKHEKGRDEFAEWVDVDDTP